MGRDGPKSYVDVVGHFIHQEAWIKTKKSDVRSDEGRNKNVHSNRSPHIINRQVIDRGRFQ